jgi:hypothetical protein
VTSGINLRKGSQESVSVRRSSKTNPGAVPRDISITFLRDIIDEETYSSQSSLSTIVDRHCKDMNFDREPRI